jgi:hypothetical protein
MNFVPIWDAKCVGFSKFAVDKGLAPGEKSACKNMKTIQAQLKVKRGKMVPIEIPTDEEIEGMAMRMHAAGKPCLETVLGHKVFYRPRSEGGYTLTEVDPFTGEQGKPSAPRKFVCPAEFTFGYGGPWMVVLSWQAGDDKPPAWFRYEDKLIRQDTGHMV